MISLTRTIERLDQLYQKGQAILQTRFSRSNAEWVDHAAFAEWSVGCRTFLDQVLGPGIEFGEFERLAAKINDPRHVERGLAILRAVKENLEFGRLGRLEELVSAAIFDDFLGMAESLLAKEEAELVDLAAYLTGAVLENGMKRVAAKRGVPVKERDGIASLNSKLADAQVYNNLWRRKVGVWNEVRDNADHGRFGTNSAADVKGMIEGVRDFLAEFLQ